MATSAERRLTGVVAACLSAVLVQAQRDATFAYTGNDAVRSAESAHFANFGGLANNVAVADNEPVASYLPSLFYEGSYLLGQPNHTVNIGLDAMPEVFLNVLFMGRVTATADLLLLSEAQGEPGKGFGMRVGAGFSALGSTFGLTETTPVLRAGFLFNNIRITYAYGAGSEVIVKHQLAIAIKFDW